MTVGSEPRSNPRNIGDLVAPWVLILAPFWAFLHLHGRSPFAADSLLIAGAIVLAGVVAGRALSALRGTVLYLVAVTALLLIAVDLQFAADGRFRVIGLVVLVAVWVLREHITSLAAITVSALTVLTLITGPQDRVERSPAPASPTSSRAPAAATLRLPPILHLVLDEHIGLGGFSDSPVAEAARIDVRDRYQSSGFRIYARAFSEYSLTANALPNALNFSTEDEHYSHVGGAGTSFPAELSSNAYFARVRALGYVVHVYQPAFVDLCSSQGSPVESCTTAPGNSLLTVERIGLPPTQRAGLVLRYWLANESYLYDKLRRIGSRLGLPAQPAANARVGPGGALELLARLEEDISAAPNTNGKMYFAHLLIPHSPFFFDEQCVPTSRPLAPDVDRPLDVEAHYLAQVQCVSRKITSFLDRIADAIGDEAIVMVHGDHGARIGSLPRASETGDLDSRGLADWYSTFFAIRSPGADPEVDESLISIRELIDQLSSSSFDTKRVQPGAASVFLDFRHTEGRLETYAIPDGWLARSE